MTATTHATERDRRTTALWPVAALLGAAAGLVRPAAVAAAEAAGVSPGPLALALQADLPYWWAIHLVYSAAFGVGFALLVGVEPVREYAVRPTTGPLLGVGYGLALWVVNVLVLWQFVVGPLVLLTGAPAAMAPGPALGHLVYGALLGGGTAVWLGR